MANYTVWECDRCGRQEQGKLPENWEMDVNIFALAEHTYCNECTESIADWFAAGKTPHRKRGPRAKKTSTFKTLSTATTTQ